MNTDNEYVRGDGWVLFAGVILLIAGFLNVIYGLAALDDSAFFVEGDRFVIFDDLNTWGWIHLVVGLLQVAAAFSVWSRHTYGRVIGVTTAAFSMLTILMFINAAPLAAFSIFVLDLLVIYGLVVYGGRQDRAGA